MLVSFIRIKISAVGWAEQRDAQHSDESQSLGFAMLSANLQNPNIRNHPNLPRLKDEP
jgi:hypothetical protein